MHDDISSRKTRRRNGDGSGCIYYRTVTNKGKKYRNDKCAICVSHG